MLYIFGDLHLSAMNPWNYTVCEKFISWFEKWTEQLEDENAEILWLGDITEKDVNPGDVIDQEYRIFSICSKRFKKTYVIMGNHDLKLYRQKAQHSLKFLRNFENVQVIENPCTIESCNTKVRCLPHIRVQGQTLFEYYSDMEFTDDVDLTVGHWNFFDPQKSYEGGVKLDKMRSKTFCLGHIHIRVDPIYTGSVFPNKVSEEGERVYKVFDSGKLVEEVTLPTFIKYETLEYPKPAPVYRDSVIRVYTITGISNLTTAKSFYKDLNIRGVECKNIDKEQTTGYTSEEVFLYKNDLQAFNDWLKETKYPLSRRAAVMLSDILKSS